MNAHEGLPPGVNEMFSEWMAGLKNLRDPASSQFELAFVSTRPKRYVQFYKFTIWQWSFFPVICSQIAWHKTRFPKDASDDHPTIQKTEALLSELEFGKHASVLTYRERHTIRQDVFLNHVSAWHLRQAFNSFAAKQVKKRLQIHRQPTWIRPIAKIAEYLLGSLACAFFLYLSYDAFIQHVIDFDLGIPALVENMAIIGTYLLHRLGRQWQIGDQILPRLRVMCAYQTGQ